MLWTDVNHGFDRLIEPWRELERVRRVLLNASSSPCREFPAVNLWASTDNAVVTAEIPGVDPSSLDISVAGSTLTIKGSRETEEVTQDDVYHRRERWSGKFVKNLDLPFNAEVDKINARLTKGVLTIDLPRAEAEKPKRIAIKSE